MRTRLIIICFFLPALAFGQDFQLRKKVDSMVSDIENHSGKTFSFGRIMKGADNKKRSIKYQFKYKQNKICYIAWEFSGRDSTVTQKFYIKGPFLIFSTESIVYHYGTDSIGWGGTYY